MCHQYLILLEEDCRPTLLFVTGQSWTGCQVNEANIVYLQSACLEK